MELLDWAGSSEFWLEDQGSFSVTCISCIHADLGLNQSLGVTFNPDSSAGVEGACWSIGSNITWTGKAVAQVGSSPLEVSSPFAFSISTSLMNGEIVPVSVLTHGKIWGGCSVLHANTLMHLIPPWLMTLTSQTATVF